MPGQARLRPESAVVFVRVRISLRSPWILSRARKSSKRSRHGSARVPRRSLAISPAAACDWTCARSFLLKMRPSLAPFERRSRPGSEGRVDFYEPAIEARAGRPRRAVPDDCRFRQGLAHRPSAHSSFRKPRLFMTQHFIVATAGHVDHGKSSLVKALTGIDPDRLPEEKARGITIDLGFAHIRLPAPAGSATPFLVGIVDVPGHEDFVKNMVAGVGSVDVALLLVAADDGWMTQAEEHVQILS